MHYNYYRTYNPLVGRYIQSDPLGLTAGFNTYNYVEGNPFSASDSLGLFSKLIYITEQYGLNHWAININNKIYSIRGINNILGGPFGDSELTTILESNVEFYSNYSFNKDIIINTYDLNITTEQEINLENSLKNGNKKYNLYNNNCGQYIFNALNKAGLYTKTIKNYSIRGEQYEVDVKNVNHWTPTSFEREIYKSDLKKYIGKKVTNSRVIDTDSNGNNIIMN